MGKPTLLRPGLHFLLGLFLIVTRITSGDSRVNETACYHGRNFPFYTSFNFDVVKNYIVQADMPVARLYIHYYIAYHCAVHTEHARGLQTAVVVSKLPRNLYAIVQIVNILAGDIEVNPGPITVPKNDCKNKTGLSRRMKRGRKPKHPCTICHYAVKNADKGMLCTNCNKWSHNNCTGVTDASYEYHMKNSSAIWYCPACELMNIAACLNDSDSYCSSNQFSVLDPNLIEETPEPKPVTTSSPKRMLRQRKVEKKKHNPTGSSARDGTTVKPSKNIQRNSIKFAIANFQSIRNKVTDFSAFCTVASPDIILGSESWLDGNSATAEIFPTNLQVIRKDRRNAKGGGVFIAVDQTIPVVERPDLTEGNSELAWCQLLLNDGSSIYIGSYYTPPTDSKDLDNLNVSLNKIQQETKSPYILLGGDFNIPNMSWSPIDATTTLQREILSIANEHSLEQLVNFPTRRNINGTENILDLFFTSRPSLIKNIHPYPGFSDHSVVMAEINIKAPLPTRQPRQIHQWKKMDEDKLKADAKIFCEEFLNSNPGSNTVEENWCNFRDKMHNLIDQHVPSKQTSGKPRVPWLTSKLQRLCRKKERCYTKAKKLGKQAGWEKYKEVKRAVSKELRKAHRAYIADLSEAGNKQFWKYIKTRRKDNVGIRSLRTGSQTVTDDQGKAEVLAAQFQGVFSKDSSQAAELPFNDFPEMPEIDITINGIVKLLNSLDVSKATGPDNIPNRILKLAAEQLAPILHFIFKQSYEQGYLPEDWRKANIAAIYKKGDKSDPANYRPISLTSVCCKLMEHILDSQLMKHLHDNSILTDYQHAFRRGRSCDTQLVATIHDLATHHNNRDTCDIAILDFSKAFDVVPHQKLLQKLHMYGVRNKNLEWIRSFLTCRYQRTVVNGRTSDWLPVLSGIPQGTVLGPHLFILYINDITQVVSSTARLFADDCILYRKITDPVDEKSLQEDLNNLVTWADKWGMKFNAAKCTVMRISRKRDPGHTKYTLLGEQLKEVSDHQYLGIHIENNLKWDKQTQHAATKGTRALNFLKRNFNHCSKIVKVRLYHTLVRPHLEYASIAWHPSTAKNVNLLEMVQRRAARFVTGNYSNESSVTSMMSTLGWTPLEQRRQQLRLMNFYKIINGELDLDLDKYASKKTPRLRRSHDEQYDVVSSFISTNQLANSFFPDVITQWNKLPRETVASNSVDTFKAKISMQNLPLNQIN